MRYYQVEIAKLQLDQLIRGLELEIAKAELRLSENFTTENWEFARQLQFKRIQALEARRSLNKQQSDHPTRWDHWMIRLYRWATKDQSVRE